jgi:hypothetical protein
VCIYIHTYMHINMHTSIHTYIHVVHTYKHTHTYIHIYIIRRLSEAADIIADSFKSPAYRKATTQNTPSNFTETYIKTSQKVTSAPAQPKPPPEQPPPEQPQSPLLPRRLVVLPSPGLQSVDMDGTAQKALPAVQQQQHKSGGPSPGLSPVRQARILFFLFYFF